MYIIIVIKTDLTDSGEPHEAVGQETTAPLPSANEADNSSSSLPTAERSVSFVSNYNHFKVALAGNTFGIDT